MPKPKQTRCSKTRGKKSEVHLNPSDPPRRRANKRRGHGNYSNDRPPIVGTIGRESGQVRLRVVHRTDRKTLETHVHQFTQVSAQVYTDEWRGYHRIGRSHASVCHGRKEWAKDADGDGINEVHTNTVEGMWTTVRNFLRPLRGVHKKYLDGYIAICEFSINLRCITCHFISQLVACTNS
jgi:transposase-like protein